MWQALPENLFFVLIFRYYFCLFLNVGLYFDFEKLYLHL